MIHDDGIPLHADPHERTIVYGAPLRPFVRGAAMVTERQLAAAQGVAASLQARLGAAQREIMACQTELDAERAARQAAEAQLAAERDNHALTEALYVHEIAEVLRLTLLNAEATKLAAQATERLGCAMRVLARVGAENAGLRRRAPGGGR